MALYIAVLDENPADRKQAERLLTRESSRRNEAGQVIYTDIYGSESAMMPFAEKYDLFFIDVITPRDGMMVAVSLRQMNIAVPIVLCSGSISYSDKYENTLDLLYRTKPLQARDYAALIDYAFSAKENLPERVELRNESGTIYVPTAEILYGREMNGYVAVALKGDRSFHFLGDLFAFENLLDSSTLHFLETSKNTVINMAEVVSAQGNSFRMSDGAIIRYSLFRKSMIQKSWKKYAQLKTK